MSTNKWITLSDWLDVAPIQISGKLETSRIVTFRTGERCTGGGCFGYKGQ